MAHDLSLIGVSLEQALRTGAVRAAPGDMQPVDTWMATSPDNADAPYYRQVLNTQATDNGAQYLLVGHYLNRATHDLLDQEDSWGLACAVLTVSLPADATASTVSVEEQNCPDGTPERIPYSWEEPTPPPGG